MATFLPTPMSTEELRIAAHLGLIICPACAADVCCDCFGPDCDCGCQAQEPEDDGEDGEDEQLQAARDAWRFEGPA